MPTLRHVIGLLAVATLAGSAAPGLMTPSAAGTVPVKKIRADGLHFCSWSKAQCAATDSGHRTKIHVDTRVKWIYADNDCDASSLCPGHNVKRPHHPVSSTVKSDGAVIYSMVFHHTGTYSYFCAVHHDSGMTGKVVVVP